jgi:hypothetical protein
MHYCITVFCLKTNPLIIYIFVLLFVFLENRTTYLHYCITMFLFKHKTT